MKKNISLLLGLIFFVTSCSTALPQATPIPPSNTPTRTPSPTSTSTPTLTPTATPTPVPTQTGGGLGKLLLAYNFNFHEKFPDIQGDRHIFLIDIDSGEQIPVSSELNGVNYIQDISPDGTKLLLLSKSNFDNPRGDLYLIDLERVDTPPVKLIQNITHNMYSETKSFQAAQAIWLDNFSFIYVGQGNDGFGIYKTEVNNLESTLLYKNISGRQTDTPFEILAVSNERIYWDALVVTRLTSNAVNNKYFISWVSISGEESGKIEFQGEQLYKEGIGDSVIISPNGDDIAWIERATGPEQTNNYLHIAPISDLENSKTILTGSAFDSSPFFEMTWFRDETKLLVFNTGRIEWSKKHYIEIYERLKIEMPPDFFDNYGIFETSLEPNSPVVNYEIPEDILYAGNRDGERGDDTNYLVYRNLYGISPDNNLALLMNGKWTSPSGEGNYDCLKFLDTKSFTIRDLDYFKLEGCHWIHLDVRWVP